MMYTVYNFVHYDINFEIKPPEGQQIRTNIALVNGKFLVMKQSLKRDLVSGSQCPVSISKLYSSDGAVKGPMTYLERR